MVLDIWGVGTSVAKKEVNISGPFVKKMRIGAHPDKTRIVFDSKLKKVPAYTIEKDGRAIVVRFGADAAKISAATHPAAAASPEPYVPPQAVAAPAAISEPVTPEVAAQLSSAEGEIVDIKSVNFRKVSGNGGMLSIATSGSPVYKVIESNEGLTLTLDISNAAIPEELKMTLDASELNTVVSSVSSFKPSALGGEANNSVRVLVKLNEKAAYTVKESNGTINVAFAASRAVKAVPTVTGTPAPVIEIPVVKPLEDASMQPRKYKGPNIDIDMIDAQITDILKLLAEVSDKNIVASEEVRGTITLRLKNIPWEQTFDLILQAKGLDSVEEGNVIRVAPRERLRKEKEELLAAKKAEEKQEDLQTEYIRINYDKASTLAPQIKSVLSDRGVPTVHEATNTLIIRDTKAGIAAAKDYIKQVDKPTPQVLIEARIVEAETSFARDLGIQWGVDTRVPGSTHTSKVHTAMFGSSDQLGSAAPYPDIQAATIAATPVFGQTKTGFFGRCRRLQLRGQPPCNRHGRNARRVGLYTRQDGRQSDDTRFAHLRRRTAGPRKDHIEAEDYYDEQQRGQDRAGRIHTVRDLVGLRHGDFFHRREPESYGHAANYSGRKRPYEHKGEQELHRKFPYLGRQAQHKQEGGHHERPREKRRDDRDRRHHSVRQFHEREGNTFAEGHTGARLAL